ncbi:MAG TPA: protease pro-enzyme activation domain-containing protein [Bryobacteraceae bacterium]|jgi:hypothetical protein
MELQRSNSLQPAVLAGLLAAASLLAAGPPSRIQADIQSRQTFRVTGNIHPLVASAQDQGEVPETLALPRIAIHFKMTAAQQADLDQLAEAQQNPSSPQFHQWLTPEQYADRFGLSVSDLNRITAWLQRMGFTEVQAGRGRTFVTMSGTAAIVRYAFQAPIHHYRVNGTLHYANAAEPALPIELEGMVAGILGLNDFHPRPHVRHRPRYTSSITGIHHLAPGDFATIYNLQALYNAGINGAGQSIAVVGQTDIQLSDIEAFQTASGLPVKDPQRILVPGSLDPGTPQDPSTGYYLDLGETDLDLEWAGAVARGATIIYIYSTDVINYSLTYAIDNAVAPVVSVTYGGCEEQSWYPSQLNSFNALFEQANVLGITVVVAEGDEGAADCDAPTATMATQGLAVDFPGSSPYVTSMGGTQFGGPLLTGDPDGIPGTYWSSTNGLNAGSALSYIPEAVWNDWDATGKNPSDDELSAGGGGASAVFLKPSWQTGTGVPNDGARDVPDISMNASDEHDSYLICSTAFDNPFSGYPYTGPCVNGYRDSQLDLDFEGGTSAGAPTFAGIVALINQQTHSKGQGNVNPTLYSLAATSPSAFHDITQGDNQVPCLVGTPNCTTGIMGYSAAPGYDLASGLGSVNAYNLVNAWPGAGPTPTPTPTPPPAPVLTSPANGATGVPLSPTFTWQASTGATSYWFSYYEGPNGIPQGVQTAATSYSPGALAAGTTYYWYVNAANSAGVGASSAIWSFSTQMGVGPGALLFVPVTPCRVVDTRNAGGPFGGPTMTAGSSRSFSIPQSGCNIPGTAAAYSLNVTVVPQGSLSYLTLWPTGQNQPFVSTLNSSGGIVTANAAIVPAGTGGAVSVYVTGTTDVVLDIDGYFSNAPGGAAFYDATPCRVADTRNANGSLGGPAMSAGQTRAFPVLSSSCNLPSAASAYSMNVTVVPSAALGYLTTWPTGQSQPFVSTLNSSTGKVVANAALVPAGAGGDISVYVTDMTNVILDANGYFAAPGSSGALSFYPVTPCRVADTRNANGPFGGPSVPGGGTRSFTVPASVCNIPATAQAYSLNVTVVPQGPLYYLTAWPAGTSQPLVSTLNSFDGSIVANAAIVPAGASGAISVYVTNTADVILDINGYFAP